VREVVGEQLRNKYQSAEGLGSAQESNAKTGAELEGSTVVTVEQGSTTGLETQPFSWAAPTLTFSTRSYCGGDGAVSAATMQYSQALKMKNILCRKAPVLYN